MRNTGSVFARVCGTCMHDVAKCLGLFNATTDMYLYSVDIVQCSIILLELK